ncbi:glutamate-5-semialdehyde dehydrogenase [Phaeocystidibacter marisrubri]|uniref:Gamma-glutamyl phosphate reductase n=1 Tax=Phaeocystidibacter marisrubri TaxID=1577780 RepID=A0A6L3ZK93_9FLAO|nr:glutamate-5-semialdehyde dehydrogenase [Phaeocystidibacter marisrubri]KAB2817570.1 glutamate-5-semialdehyde dehydrogenase [Phaeocystidibacter marisrubri]GGH74693.1 gamma-glutamyl phosphate reductase [Phaeocystidibacter marisrubri]
MELQTTEKKNSVLQSMIDILDRRRTDIISENKRDLDAYDPNDRAMYDRLIVNDAKVDGMIEAVRQVKAMKDPVGNILSERQLDNGLKIQNKTAPFGNILIIYESRPDVTIEAAVLAFKANSKILLKGGKEAVHSNRILVECWHEALKENGLDDSWIRMLELNREATQEFLRNPDVKLDLIVPRGGERLIKFVKDHATCPVLVSGRGNNFLFIDSEADWKKSIDVILNAKTDKISACNALDKILISEELPELDQKIVELNSILRDAGVEVLGDKYVHQLDAQTKTIDDQNTWFEEFLAMKCVVSVVPTLEEATRKINEFSGGHSAAIMTENSNRADVFMETVDSAAVYQNASTRFTDGGAMGVGAELAISTDKLHHRGPLGLDQLVTNKYYVYGNGQVR